MFQVIWFDRRLDPANIRINTWQATSTDDGQSFASARISTQDWDPNLGFFTSGAFIGDYNGLAAATRRCTRCGRTGATTPSPRPASARPTSSPTSRSTERAARLTEARKLIASRLENASPQERRELTEWDSLLGTMSITRLRRFLTDNSERAARLRQTMPFAFLLTPGEREELVGKARPHDA